ncbi:hypothetical protein F5144DRAFT_513326, partial [Chaetomium tenue]
MDSLQRSVKQTDGMLRTVIQQLNKKIESMGTSTGHTNLAGVATNLEVSLAQVQRVYRLLEYDLGKLAAIIEELPAKDSIVEEPDVKRSVIEKSGNENTEGDKALGRMEAKLDSLTTKFDQIAGLEPLVQRSETKIDDTLRICETLDTSQNLNVGRLVAIQQSLSEMKKGATIIDVDPVAAHAPALSSIRQPDRKKRKMEESDIFDSTALSVHVRRKNEREALTADQRKKLRGFLKRRSLTEGFLNRLVPCPDGGLWNEDYIISRFQSLCESQDLFARAARLKEYMDLKLSRSWFCARDVAFEGAPSLSFSGECKHCRLWCVLIKPVEPDDENEDNRYYVRVAHH